LPNFNHYALTKKNSFSFKHKRWSLPGLSGREVVAPGRYEEALCAFLVFGFFSSTTVGRSTSEHDDTGTNQRTPIHAPTEREPRFTPHDIRS